MCNYGPGCPYWQGDGLCQLELENMWDELGDECPKYNPMSEMSQKEKAELFILEEIAANTQRMLADIEKELEEIKRHDPRRVLIEGFREIRKLENGGDMDGE